MLCGPNLAGLRVDGQALGVPVAVGVERRQCQALCGLREKGVIGRDAAISLDPVNSTPRVRAILGLGVSPAITDGKEQASRSIEDDPGAEMQATAGVGCWVTPEQHLVIRPAAAVETPARHGGEAEIAGGLLRWPLGKGEVDPAVAAVVRVDGDIEEPALAVGSDGGGSRNDGAESAIWRQQEQFSALFSDQQPPVREGGHAPRNLKVVTQNLHLDGVVAGGVNPAVLE